MIFLSVTGGFASAVAYDRYQVRQAREKWCQLVAPIAKETLDVHQMPRRMTIYLAAPPGDGLRYAREHFHSYIKPVLVAAAMDWDVVEGRREGDVRFKTAERVRKQRRRSGEGEQHLQGDKETGVITVEALRQSRGITEWEGLAGDLVVGRHTWKEYVRGLHEGWLGPVDAPSNSEPQQQVGMPSIDDPETSGEVDQKAFESNQETGPSTGSPPAAPPSADEEKGEKKPEPRHPPPYIQPEQYASATSSKHIPDIIGPTVGLEMPHLLGFRNTPVRIYRFLNRRHLANSIGRDVAAAVLASHRPFSVKTRSDESSMISEDGQVNEICTVLEHEEGNWWKKTVHREREPNEESVWIEKMSLDERLANRMTAFQLSAEDADRAERMAIQKGTTPDASVGGP